MRKLVVKLLIWTGLILAIFLVPFTLHAQVQNNNLPDCQLGFSFNVSSGVIVQIGDVTGQLLPAGSSKLFDNRPGSSSSTGCNLWHLQYVVDGVSALSIEVDIANDSFGPPSSGSFSVWPAANISTGTLPLTATTGLSKNASMFGFPDWVRVFLNSATGTGTIRGILNGWRPQGTSDTSAAANQVQGASKSGATPVGNPIDPCVVSPSAVSSGQIQFINCDTSGNLLVHGKVAAGASTASVNPIPIGVRDGSGLNQFISNANPLPVATVSSSTDPATYRATAIFSPAAVSATDIFTLTGSGTKTCSVTHIQISCTATAAIAADVVVLKRSTADTSGTSSSATAVPLDSTNAAATCTALSYTANPTTGSLVGNISVDKSSITTATGAPQALIDDFGTRETQPLVLRGTSQVAAVNLNSQSITGLACDIEIEWTEQ